MGGCSPFDIAVEQPTQCSIAASVSVSEVSLLVKRSTEWSNFDGSRVEDFFEWSDEAQEKAATDPDVSAFLMGRGRGRLD